MYEIIKNIEIPQSAEHRITEKLRKLEVGDGFDFPKSHWNTSFYTVAKRIGIKIRTKNGRLWRIE